MGALLLGAVGSPTLSGAAEIRLAAPELRLRDVLRPGAPEFGRIGDRVIARLPNRSSLVLSREAIAMLVRRAVPGIGLGPVGHGKVTIRLASAFRPTRAPSCYAAARDLAPGELVAPADLAAAPCEGGRGGDLAYDRRDGSVRARGSVAAGSKLGALVIPPQPEIRSGDALTLVSQSGPVSVQLPVTALQAGRRGRRLFVREAQGRAFSVPVRAAP